MGTIIPWALAGGLVIGQQPIVIDGQLSDWESVPIAYDSSANTSSSSVFQVLRITNDQQFLFLDIQLSSEVILQESNALQLMIDADFNSNTGVPVNGIGADLIWNFGQRSGVVQQLGDVVPITQNDIRIRSGPTVSSSRYEIAIARNATINNKILFSSPSIRLVLRDGTTGAQIPDNSQLIEYTFQSGSIPVTPISFAREGADDLRIMTWNVRNDSPWNPTHSSRFGRILLATQPDIINFQEIYNHTTSETVSFVSNWYTPAPTGVWYSAGNADCKTISRYPILGSWPLAGNIAVLLDTSEKFGKPLLLINAHLPCCSSNSSRQNQIDQILAFIRNAKQPGGALTLEPDTPIVIAGDLNLVTFAGQLASLLNGQIVNQATHGPSFAPDWNDESLQSIIPRHSDKRMGYTWRSSLSTYSPGVLDFHVYTSSVLKVAKQYVVNTEAMSNQRLSSNGLLWNDSWASDHLPFIADYRFEAPVVASIAGSYVMHSRWTGENAGNPWAGIDFLKTLAREGEGSRTLSMNNLINSLGGIDGLVFDFLDLRRPELLTAGDFIFQASPVGAFSQLGNPPSTWPSAPMPSSVEVFSGNLDRVILKWPKNSIQNRWLRVTVLANANTGLDTPQTFYIGHLQGETTGPSEGFFTVSFSDIILIRFLIGQTVDASNTADVDKNGIVSFADISAARSNIGAELTVITIP